MDGYQFPRGSLAVLSTASAECRIFENRSKGLAMRMLQCNSKNLAGNDFKACAIFLNSGRPRDTELPSLTPSSQGRGGAQPLPPASLSPSTPPQPLQRGPRQY